MKKHWKNINKKKLRLFGDGPSEKSEKALEKQKKYFETLWGRPFREKSKTVEKPTKKPKKQKKKKKQYFETLA